jgi:glycerophosphoryl diester phosphodiesterase
MIKLKIFFRILGILLFLPLLMLTCARQPEPVTGVNLEATPMTKEIPEVRIIAHRGARSLAPENTLSAAIKAYESGADGWELDVAVSADGELVLLHDDTLERTSNAAQVFPERKPWSVYDFSLEELKKLDFGSWFVESDPFEQASQAQISKSELEAFARMPITTLAEALAYTKENHWWVNVEIKDASDTPADAVIVAKVVALVEELGMQDQVLISSFNHDYLRQVKALNPSIDTGALVNQVIIDPVGLLQELNAQAFHPGKKYTYEKQVKALRDAGFDVNVWTVNEEAEMLALIEMGVTGIITDFPQLLKPILKP